MNNLVVGDRVRHDYVAPDSVPRVGVILHFTANRYRVLVKWDEPYMPSLAFVHRVKLVDVVTRIGELGVE